MWPSPTVWWLQSVLTTAERLSKWTTSRIRSRYGVKNMVKSVIYFRTIILKDPVFLSLSGYSCDLGPSDFESLESSGKAGLGDRLRLVLRPQRLREADIHHQMVITSLCLCSETFFHLSIGCSVITLARGLSALYRSGVLIGPLTSCSRNTTSDASSSIRRGSWQGRESVPQTWQEVTQSLCWKYSLRIELESLS